jgi:hypothetical protein
MSKRRRAVIPPLAKEPSGSKDLHRTSRTEHDLAVSQNVSDNRAVAARVARWLVQKERPDEAVALLSAWAVRGPNDSTGQGLLAEALRINPSAKAAQQAFERMEGIQGQHPELEAAIEKFDTAELERLEKGIAGPTFRGAQIGFNNNIRAKDQVFHIQTEDSGLNAPHVITHLFADGGRVVKSFKRSYAAAIDREADIGAYVRQLMKAQHLEMVFALRDGRFDDILAGKAVGGLEVLEHYPEVDMSRLKGGEGQKRPDAGARDAEGAAPEGAGACPVGPSPAPGQARAGVSSAASRRRETGCRRARAEGSQGGPPSHQERGDAVSGGCRSSHARAVPARHRDRRRRGDLAARRSVLSPARSAAQVPRGPLVHRAARG